MLLLCFVEPTSSTRAPVQDHRQSADRAWNRLVSASKFGDCLVTVSTGDFSNETAGATGLVPGHAYAVLDIREAGTLRMLQVSCLLVRLIVIV